MPADRNIEAKRLVAEGYDRIGRGLLARRQAGTPSGRKEAYLERLTAGLGADARVLDLGCGPGEQAAWLSAHFRTTGVDISRGQVALARSAAPDAALLLADMCALPFAPGSFDAIAAIYSIIHVPREEHAALFAALLGLLRPGGRLFAVLGANAWEGSEPDWLELGATMWWSHFDATTSRALLEHTGFRIVAAAVEPDELVGEGAHLFVIAERPA